MNKFLKRRWLLARCRRSLMQQRPTLSVISEGIDLADEIAVQTFLMSPEARKHVMRLVYAEEWAKSIQESHPCSPERDEVVRQHWNEVEQIRRAFLPFLPAIEKLKKIVEDKPQAQNIKIKWF